MVDQSKPDYAAIAARRWPRAVVSGSGRYAAVFQKHGAVEVRLYTNRRTATTERRAGGGDEYDLEMNTEPTPKFVRKPSWQKWMEAE
jgi:hypothetical protein